MKKYLLLLGVLMAMSLPSLAHAGCYASYKAKQDGPLKLHFGVAEIPENRCSKAAAATVLAPRLAKDNWVLLAIVEMMSEDKLDEVKADAGEYFLRY